MERKTDIAFLDEPVSVWSQQSEVDSKTDTFFGEMKEWCLLQECCVLDPYHASMQKADVWNPSTAIVAASTLASCVYMEHAKEMRKTCVTAERKVLPNVEYAIMQDTQISFTGRFFVHMRAPVFAFAKIRSFKGSNLRHPTPLLVTDGEQMMILGKTWVAKCQSTLAGAIYAWCSYVVDEMDGLIGRRANIAVLAKQILSGAVKREHVSNAWENVVAGDKINI